MIEDIKAIKEFEQSIGYTKEGTYTVLFVDAIVFNLKAYSEDTLCGFFYNTERDAYEVSIDWNTLDETMMQSGLRHSYTTETHKIIFADGALIIKEDDTVKICLRKR